jgi:hypothetical protein
MIFTLKVIAIFWTTIIVFYASVMVVFAAAASASRIIGRLWRSMRRSQ